MRKYIIGFVCGLIVASTSAIYASNEIKVALFPAKYEFNGVAVEQKDEYRTFNLDGRAYVPIRFVAENMDAVVAYDDATMGIKVDTDFKLASISSDVKAGHLKVEDNGEHSTISGQLYAGEKYWDALHYSKMMVEPGSEVEVAAVISFYDGTNKVIDKVPVSVMMTAEGDQIKDFTAISRADLSGYAYAALEYVTPEPINAFLPPNLHVVDAAGVLGTEQTGLFSKDGISQIRLTLGLLKEGFYRFEAELNYYDGNGTLLGTGQIHSVAKGTANASSGGELHYYNYETAIKADLSMATKYTVDVKSLESISESEFEQSTSY